MRSLTAACGLAAVALMLSGCGGGSGSSSDSASVPSSSVSSSSSSGATSSSGSIPSSGVGPSSGSGTGSGSTAATGSATLKWQAPTENSNGTPLTNLAGYHIYYGTSVGALTKTIDVPSASTASYVITNLSQGTWYFAISAYTNTGLESSESNVGSKTVT